MNQVDPYIFIGGYSPAIDLALLNRWKIRRVVRLCDGDGPRWPNFSGIRYAAFRSPDDPEYDLAPEAYAACRFIFDGIRRGERVLVHCHAGISRSAAVVLLYLMLAYGATLDEAHAHLRKVRPIIRPNTGFMKMLRGADASLHSRRRLPPVYHRWATSGARSAPGYSSSRWRSP